MGAVTARARNASLSFTIDDFTVQLEVDRISMSPQKTF
jgi:hypothetical protein